MLPGAIAHVVCRVSEIVAAGDHDVVFGEVEDCRVNGGNPLVFFLGGYLVMAASSDVFLPGGGRGVVTAEVSTCFLELNGVDIVSSQRTMRLEANDIAGDIIRRTFTIVVR